MSDEIDPDLVRRLNTAVSNLPSRERKIFLAHRLDALSYDEIARRTGLTVDEVEREFAKAISRLMKQMDGHKLNRWVRWR